MEPRKREVLRYHTPGGQIPFQEWLEDLRDISVQLVILKRLDRVEAGLLGDHRYINEGVWELRVDFGPGYRVYYGEQGLNIVLLLVGGDKSSQNKDIRNAIKYWAEFKRRQ